MSAVVGYVNFGSIKGNSQDAKHKEWVEALSISQSVNRNINSTAKPREALTKSQVQLGAIDLQKNADESSPELVAAVCEGKVFPEVTIDLVRVTDNGNEVFYQWVLTDAYISSYGVHGANMGSIETSENISICYSTIKWSYKKKDEKGKAQGSVDTGWDVGANKKA
ncbi:MAG: Hcp family type VI secretion system effector [Mariniblastus sp.]